MFNVDEAIKEWRRKMVEAGLASGVVLDELESHVRQEMEIQMDPQHAFEAAVRRLGEPKKLSVEFSKSRRVGRVSENLMLGVCLAVVGCGLGLSGWALTVCFEAWGERIVAGLAVASVLGVVFAWKHAVPYLPVIANPRWRWGTGLSCIATGFVGASLFCNYVLPFFENSWRQLPGVGLWAVFIIAVFTCAGLGLLMTEAQRNRVGINRRPTGRGPEKGIVLVGLLFMLAGGLGYWAAMTRWARMALLQPSAGVLVPHGAALGIAIFFTGTALVVAACLSRLFSANQTARQLTWAR